MKVLTPGHRYELANFEDPESSQEIQFIEKENVPDPKVPYSHTLTTIHDGTTNEEVLRVLINRLNFLGMKLPSRENAIATTRLEEALMWLEKRTRDRVQRNVEGTHAP
jgi:hypothetical protein